MKRLARPIAPASQARPGVLHFILDQQRAIHWSALTNVAPACRRDRGQLPVHTRVTNWPRKSTRDSPPPLYTGYRPRACRR